MDSNLCASIERQDIDHLDAQTIESAISFLKSYGDQAKIIAGGVDLISLIKKRVSLPHVLVNMKTIPGLAYIEKNVDGLKIGPLTTIHDIELDDTVRNRFPMLAEAAQSIASPQIRNMGTVGGNLCQDVWCWYYRRSPGTGRAFFCRRKGGDQCYAVSGDNRYHAVFNIGKCIAVCPSDLAPALIALQANLKITSPHGSRRIQLEDFYKPMGNCLEATDIITEIEIPWPERYAKQRFLKFRLRKAIDFAIASVAVVLTTENEIVKNARIVLGGVAPMPYRAGIAEKGLIGKPLDQSAALAAAEQYVSEAKPLSMNRYKLQIIKSIVKKGILD